MALVRTTLAAPITATQINNITVASTASNAFPAVGAPPVGYQPIAIDDEIMFLVSVTAPNVITVRTRGADGTPAVPHDTGSSVATSATPSDFPALAAGALVLRTPDSQDIVTYGQQSEVIAIPTEPITVAFLAPTSAGAYTLGAPSLALDGIEFTITSAQGSGFAHVVNAPGLYQTGGTGSPFSNATFPAFAGASMTLVARGGFWNVMNASISPVTFT